MFSPVPPPRSTQIGPDVLMSSILAAHAARSGFLPHKNLDLKLSSVVDG